MLVQFLLVLIALTFSGERLEYDIKYGPLPIGRMVIERLFPDSLSHASYNHLWAEVEIDHHLSWIFWAKYRFESWCRNVDFLTVGSYKKTTERNYRAEVYGVFNHDSGLVRYSDGIVRPLSDSARDLLSLWYYLRTIDWDKKESLSVNAHIDRRNWQLRFRVAGKQMVKTPAGEFLCMVIKPNTDGPLGTVWLSDERARLPVLIRTKVSGLTVTASLRNISLSYEY